MQPIILGSSSPYRSELLAKLKLPFSTASPNIDESPLIGESPAQLVLRLAENKARKVAESNLSALVIGSDQVAVLDGEILGKPGTAENAVKQLQAASGKTVTFLTGLALYNAANQQMQSIVEPFEVNFRSLSETQIRRYVDLEQPLDCAGSFKSEGLGISLFSELRGSDPNSLIGLPLIRLTDMLAAQGVNVLD
ncbi:MAG: nucleoside triphosphate pyrophosphatase [Methylophaga sp.]